MRANRTQRDQRIDLRVSADLKTLLSRAAAYSGMSLSSFLVLGHFARSGYRAAFEINDAHDCARDE